MTTYAPEQMMLVTHEYTRRLNAVLENEANPRYCGAYNPRTKEVCGAKLRADNEGPMCDPCRQSGRHLKTKPRKPKPEPESGTSDRSRKKHGRPIGSHHTDFIKTPGLDAAMRGAGFTNLGGGLAYRAFSRECGINPTLLRNYANELSGCHRDRIRYLADKLGTTYEQLTGRSDDA